MKKTDTNKITLPQDIIRFSQEGGEKPNKQTINNFLHNQPLNEFDAIREEINEALAKGNEINDVINTIAREIFNERYSEAQEFIGLYKEEGIDIEKGIFQALDLVLERSGQTERMTRQIWYQFATYINKERFFEKILTNGLIDFAMDEVFESEMRHLLETNLSDPSAKYHKIAQEVIAKAGDSRIRDLRNDFDGILYYYHAKSETPSLEEIELDIEEKNNDIHRRVNDFFISTDRFDQYIDYNERLHQEEKETLAKIIVALIKKGKIEEGIQLKKSFMDVLDFDAFKDEFVGKIDEDHFEKFKKAFQDCNLDFDTIKEKTTQ